MADASPRARTAAYESDFPVWVEKLGLTVLYEPQGHPPKADVVFVHGLQGHPRRTWRYKGTVTQRTFVPENSVSKIFSFASSKQGRWKDVKTPVVVYWPKDLLPDTHESIRILTYGYDSHVSNWFSGPANKMTIAQHGGSLLSNFAQKRQDSRGRPIIFVAHSLGGLVVKEALIEARKQKYHYQLNEIYSSCHAIIFFGTPHRGSSAAKWGVLLGNIASAAQFDTNTRIVKDLSPSSGSDKLEELRRDFNDILEEGHIKIHTFQEGFGMTGLKIVSSKIVPDESSSFDSRKHEVVDMINANHMEMCRFGSKDDDGYKKFVGALAIFLDQIDARSEEISERMKAERKEELFRSLDFAERQAREHQLTSADAATFDWIWAPQSINASFTTWLSHRQGLFWISGKPGSGKSTLMSYLAGAEKTLSFLRQSSSLPWTIIRFFFDFRAGKGTANNLEGLLRTLLLELVQKVPELTTRVLEFGKDRFGESHCLDWPEKKLRQSLQDGLQACPCNVCIFVDGLDEYGGNMLDLITALRDIDDSCSDLPHAVKLCLASRPEPLLSATLEGSSGFRMQDHNFHGIQQYVRSTLKRVRTATGDDAFVNLSRDVAERSEGVFLWARLAMNDLIEGHVAGDTPGELLERLLQVPKDLHDVYSRIFVRLPDAQRDEANTLLLLVCGAKRTLKLQELRIAFNVARKQDVVGDEDEDEDLSFALLKSFRRRVLARSGGLLEIADIDSERLHTQMWSERRFEVKLIHETVRPFVENNQDVIFLAPRLQNVAAPRTLWLEVCVAALQDVIPVLTIPDNEPVEINDYERGGPWSRMFKRIKNQSRLVEYAVLFLFDHARDLEMLDKLSSYDSLRSIMAFSLCRTHVEVACELKAYEDVSGCKWCDGEISFAKESEKLLATEPSWIWATIHGLSRYCRSAFIAEGIKQTYDERLLSYAMNIYKAQRKVDDFDINATLAMISLLLEHNEHVLEKHIIRALRATPPQVLNLLLRNRTPGNLRLRDSCGEMVGPFWRLMCEEYQGSYFRRTVAYLVKRGESINSNLEPAGTALHAPLWATSRGFLWRYEVLLKKGADPNIPGPAGTPLRLAWKRALSGRLSMTDLWSYQSLMKLLLDYGAVINWVDEDGIAPTEKEIRAYCDLGIEACSICSKESFRQIDTVGAG